MSGRKKIELFYDVVSPYAWLAFEVLTRYNSSQEWNIALKLRPVFLGGIMKGSDNKPPAAVMNKAMYMTHDLQRLRKFMNVPLNQPADFFNTVITKGSLQAMRFVEAVDMEHPEKTEDLSRALWLRIWNKDIDITEAGSLREAGKQAGLSDAEIEDGLSRYKSTEVKERLKQDTEDALGYGAFGVPMIVAHLDSGPQMFFGSDRFEIISHILGEKWKGPLPQLNKAKL